MRFSPAIHFRSVAAKGCAVMVGVNLCGAAGTRRCRALPPVTWVAVAAVSSAPVSRLSLR